jgi:hypothetical protein
MTNSPRMLDCESQSAARDSLASLFSCTASDLEQFLANPALETFYVQNASCLPSFHEFLRGEVIQQFGAPATPSHVCWFHCTRVPAGTDFSEGILPLNAILPRLKALLPALITEPSSRALVQQVLDNDGGHAFHFRNKTSNGVHWGPYAILVRDVAFHASALGQHDYLAMPEIIEDLCSEVTALSGPDLTSQYQSALQPAIVKFGTATNRSAQGPLASALCYVWSCLQHAGKPEGNSVYCFDGHNVAVPPKDILKVEYL